jgi:serine/threonine protein kinase
MLYVSSIIHGTSLDILLPLAEYRDLEIFLNRGYDSESPPQKIYDFKDAFPSCETPEFPIQVMTEFFHVAGGLRWLHDELTVGGDHDVFCAHMDLKPDNILVARDQRCPVGKWMLSDFGLSIFKKSTGELSRNARTVRDVISPRTHARRAPGTYQAPEVQFREDTMVGRKSDVWSLACIFSEVLIFTIEGKDSLDAFRNKRISHGNDYFYSIEAGDRLVAGPVQEYRVKRLIIDALDELAEETLDAPQKAWVKCGIRVIVKSLTIDQDRRPDASKFHRYLCHIRAHCLASSTGKEISCPQEIIDYEQSSSSRIPLLGSVGVGEIMSSSRNNSIPSSSVSRKLEGSPRRISIKMWPRDKARRPRDRKAIALCPQGRRVGYLFADCIYVYSLNEGEINPSPVVVSLSPDMDLTHLQVSGSYLVAWGRPNSSYSSRNVSKLTCKVWIVW